MTKTMLRFALVLGAVLTPMADAGARAPAAVMAIDPATILAEVDRRAAVFEDQSYTAAMEIIKGGQLKKTLTFKAWMKGIDRQVIHFTAPGDVAGMKVLLESGEADTLYLYLPEFAKVRRVAAHMQNQGFMGSEMQLSDMVVALAPFYDAKLKGTEGAKTILELTPKAGKETAYPKIELTIDGTKGGVTKLLYFDASGAQVRQQLRDEWIKVDGKLMPTKISMLNVKTGDVTVIKLSDIQVNQGLGDDIFSRRALLR